MNTRSFRRLLPAAMLVLLAHAPLVHADVSARDDAGLTVTLPAPAQRVISLAPHVTELVYAAGGGAKLVGTVTYSDYPPAAKSVPRVGDNKALDLERIAALRPDLIVVWRHGNAERQTDALRALHIPLFFSDPKHLDDIASSLRRLGTLLGTQPAADAAAASFERDIAALRARYAARAPVTVFFQAWDRPLMTLNGTHLISDVIALCGGRNVFASLKPLVPTVTDEAVLAANPEAIVTTSGGATRSDQALPSLERWRAWPAMTAVARNNLFAIDGDLLTRPAPRIANGAAALCTDLDVARTRRRTERRSRPLSCAPARDAAACRADTALRVVPLHDVPRIAALVRSQPDDAARRHGPREQRVERHAQHMRRERANHARMRDDPLREAEPRDRVRALRNACGKLRDAFAAVRTRMHQIGGPCIERRTIDVVPALHFPRAEIEFLPAGVAFARHATRVREPVGDRRAAHERTRADARGQRRAERAQPIVQQARGRVGGAGERHVGASVADSRRDRDGRMTDQDEIHPSITR